MIKQKTIEKEVSLSGVGLHIGNATTVTLKPATDNYGIRFVRTDLPERPEIPADIDNVVGLERGTCIGIGEAVVYSVEHVMAACAGLEIDNLCIEVDGNEVPLGDGSALPFVNIIKKAGIREQDEPRHFIEISEPFLYEKELIALSVFPADRFRMTLMIDYNHPALGAQHTTLFDLSEFEKEYAPCRTFCFLSDVIKLRESGIIKGASLDSGIVVQDTECKQELLATIKKYFNQKEVFWGENGFLNNIKLKFPNELCRHKALDLMGDLYLLGAPLRAHVLGARTGHAANIAMAKLIRKNHRKEQEKREKHDVTAIQDILPHRYPFLLVDRVVELIAGKKIVVLKNVTINEPFFQGHFPGYPIMPGVLIIEAMAQAGGLLAMNALNERHAQAVYFMGIDNAKFRRPVVPGDQLRIEIELVRLKGKIVKLAGKTFVGDELACQAEFMATMADKR